MSDTARLRIGSVPYLNSVPLTRGIEGETIFATPDKLATLLHTGQLDVALLSVTAVLFEEGYDILDGVAVASHGPVKSVFLAHRRPVEEAQEIFCDTASLTSVNLLRVLLAQRGLQSQLRPLEDYARAREHDFVLLIGNAALDFLAAPHDHAVWDLGQAWHELTGLPFVYAVWALRRGAHDAELRKKLHRAKSSGLADLEEIIATHPAYDAALRRAYLDGHIHYNLGNEEKAGLARFVALLRQSSADTHSAPIHDPRYVR